MLYHTGLADVNQYGWLFCTRTNASRRAKRFLVKSGFEDAQ
jgi:hypothetical protein